MSDPTTGPDDYAEGISDVLVGPWGQGFGAKTFGRGRDTNPHPVDTQEWRDWLRGYEASETANWQTIEVPGLSDG